MKMLSSFQYYMNTKSELSSVHSNCEAGLLDMQSKLLVTSSCNTLCCDKQLNNGEKMRPHTHTHTRALIAHKDETWKQLSYQVAFGELESE